MASASPKRVPISEETAELARRARIPQGARLSIHAPDGEQIAIADALQNMLLRTLRGVGEVGSVRIGPVPDELTSSEAAELLGISRPTMVKLARSGEVEFYKVGSHIRFHREDILALRSEREDRRRQAFEELRNLEAEHLHYFDI